MDVREHTQIVKDWISLQKRTFGSVVVMEWSLVEKSMLVLALMVILYLSYSAYALLVLYYPACQHFINVPVFHTLLFGFACILITCFILIGCGFLWRRSTFANRYFPIMIILFYAITMCTMGYMVGAMSPATGVFLTATPLVGLVLFSRMLILPVTVLAMVGMTLVAYAGMVGWIPYAPLFVNGGMINIQEHSTFYFYTEMYFMLPPSVIILILSDVILRQWHIHGHEVQLLSQLDALTGLFNRRTVNEYLERLVAESTEAEQVSVLLLDLDHFKQVNDNYGHLVGDQVLKAVAQTLHQCMRKNDLAGRFGGEEFIVVLSRCEREIGLTVAERIRSRVESIRIPLENGQKMQITTSIGVTSSAPFGMTGINLMLAQADQALYQAKHLGRNQVMHFDHLAHEGQTASAEQPAHIQVERRQGEVLKPVGPTLVEE